jgi:hypothetical protein
MNSLERLNAEVTEAEKDFDENEVIELRAVYGHQQGPSYCSPIKDPVTGLIKGARVWTPQEKLQATEDVFEITGDMSFKIEDGTKFHMGNPRERAIWNCIKYDKKIAKNRDETNEKPEATHYRENLEEELEEKLSHDERIYNAEKFVRESSAAKRGEICQLMGKPTQYLTDKTILEFLIDTARDKKGKEMGYLKVEKIQKQFDSGAAKILLFISRLLEKRILRKEPNTKIIYFNEIPLGLNEEQVASYLKNKDNAIIRDQLILLLNPNGQNNP